MDDSCNECIKGSIHAGLPKGTEETIQGLNTYVIGNRTNPRAIIVIYSDIFSLGLPNNKLIADSYAASGEYLVYLPDFFKGDPVGLKIADLLLPVDEKKLGTFSKYTGILASAPTFVLWMLRHKASDTDRDCMEFLEKLRRDTPKERRIGMVGMCWGGRYAIRAGLESKMIERDGVKIPLIDAAVALHPSNLVMGEDFEKLVVPVSYGWGKEDVAVSYKLKGQVEAIHERERKEGRKVPEMEHKTYEPGRHGFSVRGNPDDPKERKILEDTVTQVLDWFKKWL
ncbi:Alpha/Beta hydrolase protein [Cadophora sp. MPI-SDFR-AT-0126]|nr:Alpha/Beta hydrolase protein [Leotiomycetes sp. MPI-SDFR-AT-0126]